MTILNLKRIVFVLGNMKKAKVFADGVLAGYLIEWEKNKKYEFNYLKDYTGPSISLTMPLNTPTYHFNTFPPFFEGFLPEGFMLDALLKVAKIDKDDHFEQLMRVGGEMVGNITVERAVV
jgi:serine/threonine-protein kinase HipA